MKTVLKVFLTVTLPLWIVPAVFLGMGVMMYDTVAGMLGDLSS